MPILVGEEARIIGESPSYHRGRVTGVSHSILNALFTMCNSKIMLSYYGVQVVKTLKHLLFTSCMRIITSNGRHLSGQRVDGGGDGIHSRNSQEK